MMHGETHRTPNRMVRCLVSYIPCDTRVQREVRSEFGTSPSLDTIRRLRADCERAPVERGYEPGWDWSGEKYRADMEAASDVFMQALKRAKAFPA